MGIIPSTPNSSIVQVIRIFNNQEYARALQLIDTLIPHVHSKPALLAFLYLRKADCLDHLSQPHIGIEYYDLCLAQNIEHLTLSALEGKAWCLFKLEKFEEALACYEQALQIENNLDKYDSLKDQLIFIISDIGSVPEDKGLQKKYLDFTQALKKKILNYPFEQVFQKELLENLPNLKA